MSTPIDISQLRVETPSILDTSLAIINNFSYYISANVMHIKCYITGLMIKTDGSKYIKFNLPTGITLDESARWTYWTSMNGDSSIGTIIGTTNDAFILLYHGLDSEAYWSPSLSID